ncbi:response regulator transcription factor [Spirosoma sp. KUDC1026]|uniref:response regulator transcription factor n=1 Tax=Spirosoma sp. KUDC1026 TaxID=2745947 RepID=UPI00159B9608|nr:response regulator transcription factor [Spirosoma sp. KUDC1026]QKZ15420.1 response regulator transcription factor [Spirosoma sp. KUDC1026]
MPTRIAIAHDYHLLTEALADLVRKSGDYSIVFTAETYDHVLNQLRQVVPPPDVLLLDMSLIRNFDAVTQLCRRYPSLRVLVLSVPSHDVFVARIERLGVHGYLLRQSRPEQFQQALRELITTGSYFPKPSARVLLPSVANSSQLNNREYNFLRWACSELTYNEIADQMCVSPRTVDGYREVVFQKMSVRTRVGMVIKAMQEGLVTL